MFPGAQSFKMSGLGLFCVCEFKNFRCHDKLLKFKLMKDKLLKFKLLKDKLLKIQTPERQT